MEKNTSRVEAFSDGVFVIALTLLILEIKVPNLEKGVTAKNLFESLFELWPNYFAFCISFLAILIMWINHHGFFRYLKRVDTVFLFANGFLMLMVTFINFPTAILGKYINTPAFSTASAFYCGTMVLISIAYNLLWFTTAYNRRLVKDEISNDLILKIRNSYWLGFFIYVLAFVVSFYLPLLGLTICISLWVFWSILSYEK